MKEEHSSIGRITYSYDQNSKLISIMNPDETVVPFTQDTLENPQPPANQDGKSANIP